MEADGSWWKAEFGKVEHAASCCLRARDGTSLGRATARLPAPPDLDASSLARPQLFHEPSASASLKPASTSSPDGIPRIGVAKVRHLRHSRRHQTSPRAFSCTGPRSHATSIPPRCRRRQAARGAQRACPTRSPHPCKRITHPVLRYWPSLLSLQQPPVLTLRGRSR